jgi:U3 small nucleolar RNA-associated protein 6
VSSPKLSNHLKVEIASIIRKRSDFEHKLNARGAKPSDFVRYIEFETNFESLRSKRAKRLGLKNKKHIGQKRLFFLLDRATKKFHGDLGLWMQYLSFCQRQKSYNKINEIITSLLRLHPTKPEVWIYAATYALDEQGDMAEARSYLQRGLRFCKMSQDMWLTYARLELIYISKITARQKILGLDTKQQLKDQDRVDDDLNADMIALPSLTAEDLDPTLQNANDLTDALKALSATPALSGAIPIAIFDSAMNTFLDLELGSRFFDLVSQFPDLTCTFKIINHIVERLLADSSSSPVTLDCFIRQPLIGVSDSAPTFAESLGVAFSRIQSSFADYPSEQLAEKTAKWVISYLDKDIDQNIQRALLGILARVLKQATSSGDGMALLLEKANKKVILIVLPVLLDLWPENPRLLSFRPTSEVRQLETV